MAGGTGGRVKRYGVGVAQKMLPGASRMICCPRIVLTAGVVACLQFLQGCTIRGPAEPADRVAMAWDRFRLFVRGLTEGAMKG
jgi:hypothetical protein